jgi:hypothetical protein
MVANQPSRHLFPTREKHVGIIADNMAEVVERTKNTMEGAVTQLRHASYVELVVSDPNVIQFNVDGIMLVHIDHVDNATPPLLRTGQLLDDNNQRVENRDIYDTPRPFVVDNRKVSDVP